MAATTEGVSTEDVARAVQFLLDNYVNFDGDFPGPVAGMVSLTRDLADSDYLTNDTGVVLRLTDGSEFLVTVQRAR